MRKRLIAGVVLAVVASAVTAGVVVVVGQEGNAGPDEVKIPPIKALKPSEVERPPGTPVPDLTSPADYGRFRILPAGSVPVSLPAASPPPGVERVDVEVRESDSLDAFGDHDLFFDPPYIPAGWELTEAHAETVIWDDGSQWGTVFGLEYQRPEYFYIRIVRFLISPDAQVQRVGHAAGSSHAYILGDIRGVPVLFQHPAPLQVYFVVGDVLTFIEGVAIDFDELINIADALIAETQAVRRRWVNVSIEVPLQTSAGDIAVNRHEALPEMYTGSPGTKVPGLRISKDVVVGSHIESSNVWVDATTGEVVHEDVRPEHQAEFDAVLATLRFEGPDAPDVWPYASKPAPTERKQVGNITYAPPDPMSGVMMGPVLTDPGGLIVVYITNGRSSRHVDGETGEILGDKVEARDREAFDRLTSSIEVLGK